MRITFSKTLLLATTAFSMISVPAANAYLSPLSFNEMYAHASRGNLTVLNNAILRGMNINAVNGDGDTVTDQTPAGGAIIPGKSAVILYAGTDKSTAKCTVPHLIGKTPSEANTAATGAGLFIRFSGTTGSESSAVRVLSQSIEAGAEVEAGTVITVQLGDTSVTD